MLSRRAFLEVKYNGIDITEYIQNETLDFSYTDNASDFSDDIELTLRDDKKRWMNTWGIAKGDVIEPKITVTNWLRENDNASLNCGRFIIDAPLYSGPPHIMQFNAISSPINTGFVTPNNKTWKKISLDKIAYEIAYKHGYELFFDSPRPRMYTEQEQNDTSDMSFLNDLCVDSGHGFKVADKKIVIFDEATYENKEPVYYLTEGHPALKSFSFSETSTQSSYDAVIVKYRDSGKGRDIIGRFDRPSGFGAKIYNLSGKYASSVSDAEYLAKSYLRKLNKKERTARIELVGNVRLAAGSCIYLNEFGFYSGKYFADKVVHSIKSGYITTVDMHKCLEGY